MGQMILARLAEPSTAAGLAAVISNLAAMANGAPLTITLPAIVAGMAAIVMREGR